MTKLEKKQELMSSTKVVFSGPICQQRQPPWPHRLTLFSTLSCNHRKVLTKLVLNVFYQIWFFGPIRQQRWSPLPPIEWRVLDLSSATAERILTKHAGKQILNVIYQVCEFLIEWLRDNAALAINLLTHFQILLCNHQKQIFWWMKRGSKYLTSPTIFSGRSLKKMATLTSWFADNFSISHLQSRTDFIGTWLETNTCTRHPLASLCFGPTTKMAALASDLLV